ncbi:MAG: hypothetical protein Q7T44_06045 [Parvibaculum sp.]|nr:hypothetical protein [Parvibaculum sp.]
MAMKASAWIICSGFRSALSTTIPNIFLFSEDFLVPVLKYATQARQKVKIDDIAAKTNFSSEAEVEIALERMKSVSEYELHLFLVMRETLNATNTHTRNKIALAQAEQDRREVARVESLSNKTTKISGTIGAASALVGAIAGALLTHYLSAPCP